MGKLVFNMSDGQSEDFFSKNLIPTTRKRVHKRSTVDVWCKWCAVTERGIPRFRMVRSHSRLFQNAGVVADDAIERVCLNV